MDKTTRETRRQSYDAVLPKREKRCRLILETLGAREMTASEITEELVAAGEIPYFNRNYVAPRLTEMKQMGILKTVGRRKATRSDAVLLVFLIVVLVKEGVKQTEEKQRRQERSLGIDEQAHRYGLERQPGETDLELKKRIAFLKQAERRAGRR